MPNVIGIDLGTTDSAMATLEAGQPTVLGNAEASRITPSVVVIDPVSAWSACSHRRSHRPRR